MKGLTRAGRSQPLLRMQDGSTLSAGLPILSFRTLCTGNSLNKGVFSDPYRSCRRNALDWGWLVSAASSVWGQVGNLAEGRYLDWRIANSSEFRFLATAV